MWRFDIINYFIKKYGYTRYLEIGVEGGDCVNLVKCDLKHGVDPSSPHATHKISSDQFFDNLDHAEKNGDEKTVYDMIFIDGLHVDDQVYRDIQNALNHLSENGTIVVHDCNPPSCWHQRSYEEAKKNGCRLWNGTVWKAYVKVRTERSDLSMCVVDTDWGCGIIRRGSQELLKIDNEELTYDDFTANRKEWLNLIDVKTFKDSY